MVDLSNSRREFFPSSLVRVSGWDANATGATPGNQVNAAWNASCSLWRPMRMTGNAQKASDLMAVNPALVAVNAAVVAFVDELLRLPSAAAAATVVDLLYGRDREAPPAVLSHVNGGIHIPLSDLLASRSPLAVVLPERLRVSAGWRADGMKGAPAAARARYRELQAAFVTSGRRAPPPAPAPPPPDTERGQERHRLLTGAAGPPLPPMGRPDTAPP